MRNIDLLDNIVYSKILFKIGNKKIHSSELARLLNKKQSGVFRQLKYLQQKGYLKIEYKQEDGRNLPDNKKLYYIDFPKIISVLLDILKERKKELLEFDKKEYIKKEYEFVTNKDFNIIHKLNDKNFIKELKHNKYLILFFRYLFDRLENVKESVTLQTLYMFVLSNVKLNYLKWLGGSDINLERVIRNKKIAEKFRINFEEVRATQGEKKTDMLKQIEEKDKEQYKKFEKEIQDTLKKYKQTNKELSLLTELSLIIEICNIKDILRIGIINSENNLGWNILKDNLKDKEFKEFKEQYEKYKQFS